MPLVYYLGPNNGLGLYVKAYAIPPAKRPNAQAIKNLKNPNSNLIGKNINLIISLIINKILSVVISGNPMSLDGGKSLVSYNVLCYINQYFL